MACTLQSTVDCGCFFVSAIIILHVVASPSVAKMVVDTELEEAKAHVLKLMDEKDKIEAELQAAKNILDNVSIFLH